MDRSIVRIAAAVGIAAVAVALLGTFTLSRSRASGPAVPDGGVEAQGDGGGGLPVCFWSDRGPVCVERSFDQAGGAPDAEALLTTLLAGPSAEERAQSIWSAIPEETTLEGVEFRLDGTVVVRLAVPPELLEHLSHETFEAIGRQIGLTLTPVGWRDLRIQTWDPGAGRFVPLASFLPRIRVPRKVEEPARDDGRDVLAGVGQPPAPGQGQPQGALAGKTVYVSAGHGWLWTGYDWRTQRPPYPSSPYEGPIIEDHNNGEAVNQYLLHYLWNAGAMVWPVRERDMNGREVIVDNDDPGTGNGYSETGVWTTTADIGYADGNYRWTHAVTGTPTATAVWTATLPADGEYAVYVWYRPGSNRALDVQYTVHHAGGETTVTVNQRVHGLTWHYVGTYAFQAGEEKRVTLDNHSSEAGKAVIADAVRFGGGTFDDLTGIDTAATCAPDKPWWEVGAFYQTQRMGVDPDDYIEFGDVIARPIYARWEHEDTGDDAVYVSWHTNGYSGYQWDYSGTETYAHNGVELPRTPGSLELRDALHTEVVNDIRAGWDAGWVDRGVKLANFGELRELWDDSPSARMPGTLIEIAYHDHPGDTDALKDPRFNMLAARAVYQGIVKYYAEKDGVTPKLLPEPPTHLAVENTGGGQVGVSWQPSPTDALGLVGDAATGYRVYTSTDGLGWSNGLSVTATTAYTFTGLQEDQLLFVRVSATNEGGESFPTEVLGARVGDDAPVLLVNGFDRLNATMMVPDYDPVEGYNLRMFLDRMNSYDYVVQHGEVISYPFDSASNDAVSDTLVHLTDYQVVDWILGEESTQDETLSGTEQDRLEYYLAGDGALFISGAEIGWDLDLYGDTDDRAFYNGYLRADYVGDDAGTYQVAPAAGSIFEGLGSFRFDAAGAYDADYPDRIAPVSGSVAALTYQGGAGGTAAVQYDGGCERVVTFGFPFETIEADRRAAVMARVMDFLGLCVTPPVNTHILTPTDGSAHNTVPGFAGTAEAGGTTLDHVEVQVERTDTGQYWDGGGWVTETWVTAVGTDTWSYTLTLPVDTDYRLRARAWAGVYSDATPAEVVFTYDTTPPTATTLITPTGGVTVVAVSVVLQWNPVPPDGGSSIAYVVDLDGERYTMTQSVYTVTSIAAGPHTWGVQVVDAAGNESGWVTDSFSVSKREYWFPLMMHALESPCSDAIVNGGFESDEGWTLNQLAVYDTGQVNSGARSARVGIPPGESGGGAVRYSSVMQVVTLTGGSSGELSLWVYPIGEGGDTGDWHYVVLFDQVGGFHPLDSWTSDARAWERREYDLSAYLGQQVTLYVGTRNDGDDDTSALYVDDVVLNVCQ